MQQLMAVLLMCIPLSGLAKAQLGTALSDAENVDIAAFLWKVWKEAALRVLLASFYLCALKQPEDCIVDLGSPYASLELTSYAIGKGTPLWRLYAKAPADIPANSRTRTLQSACVARAFVTESNSLLPGKAAWQLAFPFVCKFDVTVKGVGDFVPSWQAHIVLQGKFKDQKVWRRVVVSVPDDDAEYSDVAVSGTYALSLPAGGLRRLAYARQSQPNGAGVQSLYFLDPERSRDDRRSDCLFEEHQEAGLQGNPTDRSEIERRLEARPYRGREC